MGKRIPYDVFEVAQRIPEDSLTKATREHNQRKASLRKRSKPLSELLLDVPLVVEDVILISERVYSQADEFSIGSESRLEILAAYARDSSSKIHLNFYGNSILCSGDRFIARIPCYEEVSDYPNEGFYIPRPLGETEEAIQIQIVSEEGKLLRTERSIFYNKYK